MSRRKCVEASASQQMGRKAERCKHFRKRTVQNVEPARVGAEGGHHHTVRAGREAAPYHDVAAPAHARAGMQVAGNCAGLTDWLMPEHEPIHGKLPSKSAV